MKTTLRWSLGFLLLAGVFALLRLKQSSLVIPGSELRFTETHSIQWDAATHTMSRTGVDPYVWVALPAASIPIQDVRIEFGAPTYQGNSQFYIYQFPAYVDGVLLNDTYATMGTTQTTVDGFNIHWKLDSSKILRLDVPDDLNRPLEIRRVTIVSGSFGSWSVTLMWLSLLAGLGLPLARLLPRAVALHGWLEPAIALAFVVVKLALASDLHITVLGWATHDDALFIRQAFAIMHGHWLGKFGELTLAKGPVYSLFLAGVGLSGVPLLMAQAFLHAVACLVFVWALRPLVPGVNGRLVLLAVLLFDPHTFSSEAVSRVLRSGIQPALTLFALAGVIGLVARIRQPLRHPLGWSVLAGVGFVFFWFSREEGIWLVPSLVLIAAAGCLPVLRDSGPVRWRCLALVALPMLLFFGGRALLRTVNRLYYGASISVDVKDGAFPAAYGALMRITPAQSLVSVPVARETRLRAYAVSPAFASLRPHLEGDVGDLWTRLSRDPANAATADGEIHGGWFQWALREAAAKAGFYTNAVTADAYWARVAQEINAACDAGRLAAGPARNGLYPRWEASLWPPFRSALRGAADVAEGFSDFGVQFPPMVNSPEQEKLFNDVTHERAPKEFSPPTARTHVRIMLHHLYQWAGTPASILAALSLVGVSILAWQRRAHAREIAILLALFGGSFALMVVAALVDVTSFSAIHAMYLAPATPLLLAGWVLAPLWVWRLWLLPRTD